MRRLLMWMLVLPVMLLAGRGLGCSLLHGDDAWLPMTERERLVSVLAQCYDDPSLFNHAILDRPPYWWAQEEICRSLVKHRGTIVYSGNAIGKDYLVGGVVPWWLWTRHRSLCVVTGPAQTLLGTVTWKEIRRSLEDARFRMGARVSQGAKSSPQVVDLGNGWQALGFSTNSVERASGQHARQLLVVVEEASGVEQEAWDAIESLKYTKLLAIGNPIRAEGVFVDMIRQAEQEERDGLPDAKRLNAIHVPSTASPHADWDESPYGLADRTWLEACYRKYGRDSLWVRSHIDAIIPDVSSEALIPEQWLDWCTACKRLELHPADPRNGPRRLSCDLGEGVGRDSTCLVVRDDLGILEVVAGNALGLPEAARQFALLAQRYRVQCPRHASYDGLGIGKDFAKHLAKHGVQATPYFGEGSPRDKNQFTNIRSEAAWKLRNRLNPDLSNDPRYPNATQYPFHIPAGTWWPLMREDLKVLRYDLVGKLTRLIKKEDLLVILGRSPDRGDALIQSFAFC